MAEPEVTTEFSIEELANEEWRTIIGYEGTYSVSILGRVRRDSPNKFGPKTNFKHILAFKYAGKTRQYRQVALSLNGKVTYHYVHILVANAFIYGPKHERPEVNHKNPNGDTTDNRAWNLEWTSSKGNKEHARDTLGRYRGERAHAAVLTEADVIKIRLRYRAGELVRFIKLDYKPLSEEYLHNLIRGNTWKHVPYATPARGRWN